MTKRRRFVVVSLLLATVLWLVTNSDVEYRLGLSLGAAGLAYILSVWVLFDDLKGIEWLTLMVLPTMFTLGATMFANFLPTSVPRLFSWSFQVESALLMAGVIRVLYFICVAVCLYGVLLIENIFSVASIRTIQLFRAARSVNFIFTLLTALFFYTTIFGLKMPFYWNSLLVFLVTAVLAFPSLWCVDLKSDNFGVIRKVSLMIAMVLALVMISLSFWPLKPFMGGLIMTSLLYTQLGVLEQRMTTRVYLEGVVEYVITVLIILTVGYLTTSWTSI